MVLPVLWQSYDSPSIREPILGNIVHESSEFIAIFLNVHNKTHQNCAYTVETLYSTIYNSKYFIELNIDKSTQYVAL